MAFQGRGLTSEPVAHLALRVRVIVDVATHLLRRIEKRGEWREIVLASD